jgi:hypothetical protein
MASAENALPGATGFRIIRDRKTRRIMVTMSLLLAMIGGAEGIKKHPPRKIPATEIDRKEFRDLFRALVSFRETLDDSNASPHDIDLAIRALATEAQTAKPSVRTFDEKWFVEESFKLSAAASGEELDAKMGIGREVAGKFRRSTIDFSEVTGCAKEVENCYSNSRPCVTDVAYVHCGGRK